MIESLSSPVANALTLTLLHFLWQGLLIVLAYWALLSATGLRSAQSRYAVSLLTLVMMAACPVATYALLYDGSRPLVATSTTAIPNGASEFTEASVSQRGGTTSPRPAVATGSTASQPTLATSSVFAPLSASVVTGESNTSAVPGEVAATAMARPTITERTIDIARWLQAAGQPYVLLVWLAGVLLSGARLTAGLLNVVWLRSGRMELPAPLMGRCTTLARQLGLRSARVSMSLRIGNAAVVGFWKPVVLLPAAWLTALPADVLEAVIAHELAHIRRFDVWVNLFQRILETLLFYHPAVWWLSNKTRLEREMCCDELAVEAIGDRGHYALALEQVGRLQVRANLQLSPAFTGNPKMKLLNRIQYVLGTTAPKQREPAWLVGIGAIAIAVVVIGFGGMLPGENRAMAQEREDGKEKAAETGARRDAEGEGKRGNVEEPTGRRGSAEGAKPRVGDRRPSEREGDRRSDQQGERGVRDGERRERDGNRGGERNERRNDISQFRPQTQREAALFQMIQQLQRELSDLRREVRGQQGRDGDQFGPRDGEGRRDVDRPRGGDGRRDGERERGFEGRRDGDNRRPVGRQVGEAGELPVGWERTKAGGVFKAYDKNGDMVVTVDEWLAMTNGNINADRKRLQTERFQQAGPGRDGKMSPAEFFRWWNGREGAPRGPRDGEGGRQGSPEGQAGPRRSPEGERGPQRSPEGERGSRRTPAEGGAEARRGSREG